MINITERTKGGRIKYPFSFNLKRVVILEDAIYRYHRKSKSGALLDKRFITQIVNVYSQELIAAMVPLYFNNTYELDCLGGIMYHITDDTRKERLEIKFALSSNGVAEVRIENILIVPKPKTLHDLIRALHSDEVWDKASCKKFDFFWRV